MSLFTVLILIVSRLEKKSVGGWTLLPPENLITVTTTTETTATTTMIATITTTKARKTTSSSTLISPKFDSSLRIWELNSKSNLIYMKLFTSLLSWQYSSFHSNLTIKKSTLIPFWCFQDSKADRWFPTILKYDLLHLEMEVNGFGQISNLPSNKMNSWIFFEMSNQSLSVHSSLSSGYFYYFAASNVWY